MSSWESFNVRSASHIAGAALVIAAVVVAVASASPTLAQSGDANSDSVKQLMGKAQSTSERRAVEDLISKLQAASKAQPALQPVAPTPVVAPAQDAKLVAPAAPQVSPVAPAKPSPVPAKPALDAVVKEPVQIPLPASPAPALAPTPAVTASPPTQAEPPSAPVAATPAPPVVTPPKPAVAAPAPVPPARPPAPAARKPAVAAAPAAVGQAPAIAARDALPTADLAVYFEFGSAKIAPGAMALVAILGQTLSDPRLADQTFVIGGYTDGKGSPDYNARLSQARAEAVRQVMIGEFQIDPKRLIAKGFGKTQLKDPKNPLADENRRVQIINWTSQLDR